MDGGCGRKTPLDNGFFLFFFVCNEILCTFVPVNVHKFCKGWALVILLAVLSSCSVSRFVPGDSYLLDRVSLHSDSAELKTALLQGYIRQHPNRRWFSALKVPLGIYCLSGSDSTKYINRFIRKMGEAPVIYNEELAQKAKDNIQSAVRNMGYLNADVEMLKLTHKKKVHLLFRILPSTRFKVRNLNVEIPDTKVDSLYRLYSSESYLAEGMNFDFNVLDRERSRLNTLLANNGYYKFNKDYIRFEADTTLHCHMADLTMRVSNPRGSLPTNLHPHQQYRLGHVDIQYDSTFVNKSRVRHKVLRRANELYEDSLYCEENVQQTYARMMRLGAVMSTNIHFQENQEDSTRLDTYIKLTPSRLNSVNAELEGTNSAGDLGAAVGLTFMNRNIFHGSEIFSIKLRGAYEAIKGLNGYMDQDYIEYSAETGVTIPDFKFPFLKDGFRHSVLATSEASLMFDSQNRPEFHRRVVTAAWRYRWSRFNRRLQHRVDLLDLNYVFMPWISETFRKRYLDDPENRNAILRYNYENLFIMKWGYNFTLNSQPLNGMTSNYGTNAYTFRAGIESSGNFLYGLSNLLGLSPNSQNQYTLFNIAYAQYMKADVDFAKSFRIDEINSLAVHFGLGVAYPYGNTNILPYEKRYFSGGANSVRGWSVRELGPGSFRGTDGRIDFINQMGDIKLDMNLEYRAHLFWKLHGALFADAGNIWTIRNYVDQPGGQFRFDTFWKQIAVSYGLGIRLNFDYFILRLDAGMKAIHPAYTDARHHYPIIHPNFGRDFSLHFAVGLPF